MSAPARIFDSLMTSEYADLQPDSILAVIPTLNEARHIEACIRSLMTGSEMLREIPLVVADGGSTDDTLQIVERLQGEFKNLSVIENPDRLQSAAINLAAEIAATEASNWLVRCDAHAVYPENYILDITRSLIETRADSVVVPMDAIGKTWFEKANAWIVDTPLGSGRGAHRGGATSRYVDHGHHAGFGLAEFIRIGGYDETFSHNEDAEYDVRLADHGGRIFLDAEIRVQYIPKGGVRALAKQYFQHGKGRARTAAKHDTPLKIRQMLPVLALLANLVGLVAALWVNAALLIPAVYLTVLFFASIYVIAKRRALCGALSGIALGVMHMSWAAGFLTQVARELIQPEWRSETRLFNPRTVIPNLGRSTLNFLSSIFGGDRRQAYPRAANSNYQTRRPVTRVTQVPDTTCVYAIGDIHGRFDLLEALLAKIEADADLLPEGTKPTIVFLGDYIDRGLQSRQIVDLFLSDRLAGFETVFLMGNHEEALLKFFQDPGFGEKWAMYGGAETLFSYGLQPPQGVMGASASGHDRDAWVTLWNRFRATLPENHLSFYQSLQLSHTIGDYVFVHAGMKPGVALEDQRGEDMLWIRDEFLDDRQNFEKLVVHGHTPADAAHRDDRRVGLDTGAYMTGRLTAARFMGNSIEFLST